MTRSYRRTTTRDIARLRELAASGASMRQAAKLTGVDHGNVSRLSRRFGLPFGHAHLVLADLARARLGVTMQRLQSYQKERT